MSAFLIGHFHRRFRRIQFVNAKHISGLIIGNTLFQRYISIFIPGTHTRHPYCGDRSITLTTVPILFFQITLGITLPLFPIHGQTGNDPLGIGLMTIHIFFHLRAYSRKGFPSPRLIFHFLPDRHFIRGRNIDTRVLLRLNSQHTSHPKNKDY